MASKLKQQLMENKRNIFYASIILATHFAYVNKTDFVFE